ncbi:MAG: HU family DNA-binding protein [Thermosulfidibacteraceae bacterium]|jgi:nucleoid DNA-binding protein
MIRSDLIEKVARVTGSTKIRAREVVDAIFDTIFEKLAKGERVSIRGFGIFEVVTSNRTKARDLKTGKEIRIEPKRVVRFKPSKKIIIPKK